MFDIYTPKEYKYAFTVQQAQEMRKQVILLKSERESNEILRNLEKGHKKRPFTKRIKEVDAELETLKEGLAESPPEPMSNDEAVQIMRDSMTKDDNEREAKKVQAIESIENDNFNWYAYSYLPDLIFAEIRLQHTNYFLETDNIFDLFSELYKVYQKRIADLIRSDNLYNSTSETSNVISMIKHQTISQMVRYELYWWLKECEQLCEQVKSYDALKQKTEDGK